MQVYFVIDAPRFGRTPSSEVPNITDSSSPSNSMDAAATVGQQVAPRTQQSEQYKRGRWEKQARRFAQAASSQLEDALRLWLARLLNPNLPPQHCKPLAQASSIGTLTAPEVTVPPAASPLLCLASQGLLKQKAAVSLLHLLATKLMT
jgi:hypothetical protein